MGYIFTMKNSFFILCLLGINFIRALLYPLFGEFLPLFSKQLRKRRDFEKLNLFDPMSRSYRSENRVGHILFHVSSEGELEQVRPLISYYLEQNYNLELVYTSESVEKKCQQLAVDAEGRLKLFRLPILSFFFFSWRGAQALSSWCTAKRVVMCRYDFFPELLLLGARPSCQFVLVNASLKGKEKLSGLRRWYYRSIYRLYNAIVAATTADVNLIKDLVGDDRSIEQFDFRIMQIERRVRAAQLVLKRLKLDELLQNIEERFPRNKRLIMGSAWANEIDIFDHREFLSKISLGELFVWIAPHKLNAENLEQIESRIAYFASKHQIHLPVYTIKKNATSEELSLLWNDFCNNPGIIISLIPGCLCELYRFFGHSYVGGGHGRSIHSVLEPFVAGSHIFCGPKTFRSTEFDYVKEYDASSIVVFDSFSDFYPQFKTSELFEYALTEHQHFISKSVGRYLAVVQQLHLG